MALPSSGPLSIEDIAVEFSGVVSHTHPDSLSEYYGVAAGVPTEGTIAIGDFYGAEATNYISATGGTITTTGGKRYHSFTSNGTFNVVESATGFASDSVEMVLIGGGGSGGQGNRYDTVYGGYYYGPNGHRQRYNTYRYGGGGGGAGGFATDLEPDSANLSNKSIIVGYAGAQSTSGANGGYSFVSSTYPHAYGGGRGASSDSYSAGSKAQLQNSGSGGGNSAYYSGGVVYTGPVSGYRAGAGSEDYSQYQTYYFTGSYYLFIYTIDGGGGGGAGFPGGGSTGNGTSSGAWDTYTPMSSIPPFDSTPRYGAGGWGGFNSKGTTRTWPGSGGSGGNWTTQLSTNPSTTAADSGASGVVVLYYDYV